MAAPSVWLIGGCEMADDKGTALAPRSRSAPRVAAPRNKVNVALPFSKITAEEDEGGGLDQPGWTGDLGHRIQRCDPAAHPHRKCIRSGPGEPSSEPRRGRFAC